MLKTRFKNAVFLLGIVAGLAVMFWVVLPRLQHFGHEAKISETATVLQQVQTLSQLVTVKYVMEKVVILSDPSPFGEMSGYMLGDNRVLMVAHGVVKAGINLEEVKSGDIEISKGKVRIKLPPARITDYYLDDKQTQIVDRTKGILRSYDKDLEQNARRQAVEDINRAARSEGILKDASDRARTQLTNLFHQLGFADIEFNSP